MTSFQDGYNFQCLLTLRKELRWMMLDRLNLEYLQPLRDEVEEKIQHHIDLDKLERGELKQCPR